MGTRKRRGGRKPRKITSRRVHHDRPLDLVLGHIKRPVGPVTFATGRWEESLASLAKTVAACARQLESADFGPYAFAFDAVTDNAGHYPPTADRAWAIYSSSHSEPPQLPAVENLPAAVFEARIVPGGVAIEVLHGRDHSEAMKAYLKRLLAKLVDDGLKLHSAGRIQNAAAMGENRSGAGANGSYQPDRVDLAMMRVIKKNGPCSCAHIRSQLPPTERQSGRRLRDRARRLEHSKYVRIEGTGKGTLVHLTDKGEARLKRTLGDEGLQSSV